MRFNPHISLINHSSSLANVPLHTSKSINSERCVPCITQCILGRCGNAALCCSRLARVQMSSVFWANVWHGYRDKAGVWHTHTHTHTHIHMLPLGLTVSVLKETYLDLCGLVSVCVSGRNEVRSLFTLCQSRSVRQMIKCFKPGSDIRPV